MVKYAFLSVILVLVAVLVVQQKPQSTTQTLPSFNTFKISDVTQVALKKHGEVIMHGKHVEEEWLSISAIKEPAVKLQTAVIEQLLHDLQSMQIKRVVSHQAENHDAFAVNAQQVTLKNEQGEVLLDVFVGKPAKDLISTYIRFAGQDEVLTVDKILTWQVKRTAASWLDKDESISE